MAALSYLWVMSVVMLVVKKDDEFVKFHAKQGSVLFIISVVAMILSPMLWFIGIIIWAGYAILSIIGFIKALSGERYVMPVIGNWADKIKL